MFLDASIREALTTLAVDQVETVATREHMCHIGIGYAVAKGWATYQGAHKFQITTAGEKALAEILNPTD